MKKNITYLLILFPWILSAQEIGKTLAPWQEGEMEIHHIYTGKGEAVFCIFPDGTNMLIDAGDTGPDTDPRKTNTSPNNSRHSGEWIARYITNHLPPDAEREIDYALLTHFHGDHMGGLFDNSKKTKNGGEYYLSGLSEVYEYLPYSTLVDRNWPSYQYPKPQTGKGFLNYLDFVQWNVKTNHLNMERFIPGTNKQFVLKHHPEKYPEFEIRNIVANGEVWTGKGDKTKKYFPKGKPVDENKCSVGIRISYGDFNYFNGGDLTGRISLDTESWKDIETPVGKAVGPVEVCEANHHAWIDAMNESFLSSVQAQIIIMQVYHITHFNLSVMKSMRNKKLNPNLKHIIPTAIPEISKVYFGAKNLKDVTGNGGHVVIKVDAGGENYSVLMLTTQDESFRIKSIYGPFKCH